LVIRGDIPAEFPALAPPAASVSSETACGWLGKRTLDVIGSLLLLVVFLPVLIAVALALKLSSRGPVLFRQTRVGRGDRSFTMLKFRTMYHDAEERLCSNPRLYFQYLDDDHKIAIDKDPRITPVGRFLRKSSLDELPQLFNVVAGDMSLVGPRPVTPAQWPSYQENHLANRFRPGLTGLWQVSGRNEIRFPERAQIDAEYCAGCSLRLDLSILARTPLTVLSRRGAS
jgi:exopolysaccharide production protein ExoY